ncbi:hypothetical protein QSU92_01775 [Microbacterium sp. ET2]|uniref:hypothetical protein n=1 Tax=Microbacterium albipurpureum TaxID=3050384 RepID=UPI00259C9736|nr:hypothetical protein [Microbacterium sp. ET2 (Ac-2212)]WJL95969.1 hypothetical protein QSU92_01775 [Microbacterium sp. ET2 (Ac-2212)]
MTTATIWCRSRSAGAVCTRPAGHPGLHNRVGTGRMWSNAQADAPRCSGSGRRASAAPSLPGGFPNGKAVCPVCWGFVALEGGALCDHDAYTRPADDDDAADRAAWFNAYGWSDGDAESSI